jgi:hypothetical protein
MEQTGGDTRGALSARSLAEAGFLQREYDGRSGVGQLAFAERICGP